MAVAVVLVSCKPSVPEQYIQPDDMEDLIYDYHLAQGIASQENGNPDYNNKLTFELVLKKYGYTKAEFDSSLVYYYTRADRLQEIYKHVTTRLDEEAELYGADVNRAPISANSLGGDTTDVWKGKKSLMLLNDRPYHLYQFSQQADTAFHSGDSFMLNLNTTWLMQQGNRQAAVYMAITYENDSITKQYATISTSGTTSLRIPYCKERVKEIKGFMMCGMRPSNEEANKLCLLFINNIQLFRLRHKTNPQAVDDPKLKQDTLPAPKQDMIPNDSLRKPLHTISNKPLTVGEMQKMRQVGTKK